MDHIQEFKLSVIYGKTLLMGNASQALITIIFINYCITFALIIFINIKKYCFGHLGKSQKLGPCTFRKINSTVHSEFCCYMNAIYLIFCLLTEVKKTV